MENKDIRIINETTTIELSKKFAKAAQYFGTDEFNTLQNVRAMFPGYSVKVKTIKKAQSKDSYKDLDYAYMESYIKAHDKDGAILNKFNDLRAKTPEAIQLDAKSKSYGTIKHWFLNTFPEIKGFREYQDNLVKKAS